MKKEIGSNFWEYDDNTNNKEKWHPIKEYFKEYSFISGRNATYALCYNLNINPKIALLPCFTCETVIRPFEQVGWKITFYPINKDLTISPEYLEEQIEKVKPTLILFHNYFGFNTCENIKHLIEKIKSKKIVVIEDITQNLFSEFEKIKADYYVASLRKWSALPDGGMLVIPEKNREIKFEYSNQTNNIYNSALKAFEYKKRYMNDENIEKSLFMDEYLKVKKMIANIDSIQPMSDISKKIFVNLDKEELKYKRQKNYKKLLENLKKYDEYIEIIFKEINENEVPLYFPIYIKENRAEFQKYMANNNIYCPIIWNRPSYVDNVEDESMDYIYNHILSIPCDQRYDEDDIERIIDTIDLYFN